MQMIKDNIFVFSHRRSGTHFVIDSLLLNLKDVYADYMNLDQLLPLHPKPMQPSDFHKVVEDIDKPIIFKTHSTYDLDLFRNYPEIYAFVRDMAAKSKKIYVYRDGKDVLVSLYEYMRSYDTHIKEMIFPAFLRSSDNFYKQCNADGLPFNRVEMWKKHVDGFMNREDIYCVAYEDLLSSFSSTMNGLLVYLNVKAPKHLVKPVIVREILSGRLWKRSIKTKKSTAIVPRKGIIGDYKNYFNDTDLEFFHYSVSKS